MRKLLFVISTLFIFSCSSDEDEKEQGYINEYSHFLALENPQFNGDVNGNFMIYEFGYNTFQMGSESWNPKGNPKEPIRQLLFALNQENGGNQFLISTPTYDSSSPTELNEIFRPGIKKIGPGDDSFYIQIISDNETYRICDVESDFKIEVLKAKEINSDEYSARKINVWFKIDRVNSETCSTDTYFDIRNALILAHFIQH